MVKEVYNTVSILKQDFKAKNDYLYSFCISINIIKNNPSRLIECNLVYPKHITNYSISN